MFTSLTVFLRSKNHASSPTSKILSHSITISSPLLIILWQAVDLRENQLSFQVPTSMLPSPYIFSIASGNCCGRLTKSHTSLLLSSSCRCRPPSASTCYAIISYGITNVQGKILPIVALTRRYSIVPPINRLRLAHWK